MWRLQSDTSYAVMKKDNTSITAVWLLQLAELAGKGTSDYVVQ